MPDEHTIAVNERNISFISNEWYFDMSKASDMNPYDAFVSDHSLFIVTYLVNASKFRDMKSGYGIVPMPKYDETQKEYVSFAVPDLAGVPYIVADAEASSIILEALQYESWKTVRPAYFDITLKDKYSCDSFSGQMLDILMENPTCCFTYLYGYLLGNDCIPEQMCNKEFNTWMAKRIDAYQKKADMLFESRSE